MKYFQFHQGLSANLPEDECEALFFLSIPSRIIITAIKKAYNNAIITFNSIKDYRLNFVTNSSNDSSNFQFHQGLSRNCICKVVYQIFFLSIPSRIIFASQLGCQANCLRAFNSIKDYRKV